MRRQKLVVLEADGFLVCESHGTAGAIAESFVHLVKS